MRAMYSSFSSATHHIFFPPRLQFVALKQDADCLPAHLRCQLPLYRFGGDQAHTPPRYALWGRRAHHGDDPLALAYVQGYLFAGPRRFVQRRVQPFFLIAPGNSSHRFRSYAHTGRHLRRLLTTVELAQDRRAATRAPIPAPSSASWKAAADPSSSNGHTPDGSSAWPHYAALPDPRKVPTKIHLYTVTDLVEIAFHHRHQLIRRLKL